MKFYHIDAGEVRFHGTKEGAIKAARAAAREGDTTVTVELCVVPDNRAAMIDLANGNIETGTVVATVGPNYGKGRERS